MTWVSIFQNPTTLSLVQGLVAGKERVSYLSLGWGYEERKSIPRIVCRHPLNQNLHLHLGSFIEKKLSHHV